MDENEPVDKLVPAITALLHDIGKTLERDEKILREQHEELGKEVSSKFLDSLEELTEKQKLFIKDLFQKNHASLEKKIMKDADYLDFYQNNKLHDAFKTWADENNLPEQIKKKIVRFEKMSEKAQALALPYLEALKKKWQIA